MMAVTTNMSTRVFGVHVWRIQGMGDSGDRGAMARTTTTHPTTPQTTATRELAERLRSAGGNQRRAEEGRGDVDDGSDDKHVDGPPVARAHLHLFGGRG